jgi:PIN domain nuclease of toxin-antitoxin system
MTFLIDTHVLIWYIEGDTRLEQGVISVIENSNNRICVSNASLWEMAIKISIGKLKISLAFEELERFLKVHDFGILDFDFSHLNTLITLPSHHGDPFDRLIISQALTENYTIISHDKSFDNYTVEILR